MNKATIGINITKDNASPIREKLFIKGNIYSLIGKCGMCQSKNTLPVNRDVMRAMTNAMPAIARATPAITRTTFKITSRILPITVSVSAAAC